MSGIMTPVPNVMQFITFSNDFIFLRHTMNILLPQFGTEFHILEILQNLYTKKKF